MSSEPGFPVLSPGSVLLPRVVAVWLLGRSQAKDQSLYSESRLSATYFIKKIKCILCFSDYYILVFFYSVAPKYIKMFVLDEADEMLSRGFKDQIYDIFQKLNSNTQVRKTLVLF